jgi:hypothetical protein
MKFVCLGCMDKDAWGRLSPAQQQSLVEECIAFDRELYAKGHFAAGYALQDSAAATTVRWSGAKASLVGGILILEAKDKAEALALIGRHPGIRIGPFEVRPVDDAFMAQHPILKKQ